MGVEYDGSAFHGWQIQREQRTVQGVLEAAIARVADHAVTTHCAGRTDAGVHALAQVVHFESDARRRERSWVLGTNVNLPADVNVLWARPVGPEFHARFSAAARHYRYRILSRPTRSALHRHRAAWIHYPLDVCRMSEAAQALIGRHDFTSFRAVACQAKSPIRTVHYIEIEEVPPFYEIAIGADGFLQHMVRNIAGVLMAIGRGDAHVGWVSDLLDARDRTAGGVTAPPDGLYLVRIDYPDYPELAEPDPSFDEEGRA